MTQSSDTASPDSDLPFPEATALLHPHRRGVILALMSPHYDSDLTAPLNMETVEELRGECDEQLALAKGFELKHVSADEVKRGDYLWDLNMNQVDAPPLSLVASDEVFLTGERFSLYLPKRESVTVARPVG